MQVEQEDIFVHGTVSDKAGQARGEAARGLRAGASHGPVLKDDRQADNSGPF